MGNLTDDTICEDGCGCAACSTLVIGPFEDWVPVLAPAGTIRTCCFCRTSKQVHHFTPLAMPVCHDCNPA